MMFGVFIVASGPTAKGFVPPDDIPVIAVNGAIEWIARADYWFTLDPSPDNMRRMNNRRAGVQYCAAVQRTTVLPEGVARFTRKSVPPKNGTEPMPRGTPEWWLWRLGAVKGLSSVPQVIHTGNSAYGALGLAKQLGFSRAALVGVDGDSGVRVEGGHSRALSHLPALFESAMPDMDFVVCGNLAGEAFKRMSVQEAAGWLRK